MEEKIVCVTGASKGIGAEICVKLAKAGCVVVGLARSVDKISDLNQRLQPENGSIGKIIAIKCDLENENEIQEAFKWIKTEYGKLDIFINNAGVLISNFVVEETSTNYRKMFDVNVIASCICIKEAVALMRETTGRGHIIVINSALGHRIPDMPFEVPPPFGVYPATKYALTALCQTVRQELSFLKLPIKVTSISPGMVQSEMLESLNQNFISMLPKLLVEDVADAVIYAVNTPNRVRIDEIIISPMIG